MDISFNDYLIKVSKCSFPIDDFYEEKIVRRLRQLESDKKTGVDFDVESAIFESLLGVKEKYDAIAVLCGGGIDSNYLLLALLEIGVKPLVFSAETKGNSKSLRSTEVIVREHGLTWSVSSYSENHLESSLRKFYDSEGRWPNDPAMPIVCCLYEEAIRQGADIIIDGQFADTVLFANPQNYLFNKTKNLKLPRVSRVSPDQASISKVFSGLIYLSMTKEEKILFLCRADPSDKSLNFVARLLERYDEEDVLQCIFFEFLLNVRERDKYRVKADFVYSPFDNFAFLCKSSSSKRRGKTQKKFMIEYIKRFSPKAASLMKSMSFEAK